MSGHPAVQTGNVTQLPLFDGLALQSPATPRRPAKRRTPSLKAQVPSAKRIAVLVARVVAVLDTAGFRAARYLDGDVHIMLDGGYEILPRDDNQLVVSHVIDTSLDETITPIEIAADRGTFAEAYRIALTTHGFSVRWAGDQGVLLVEIPGDTKVRQYSRGAHQQEFTAFLLDE
jgi:hypothetical protein